MSHSVHLVCKQGWHDILRLMLTFNVQLDAIDDNGDTLLLVATRSCHDICSQILIKKNACLNKYDADYNTSLHIACKNGWTDTVTRSVNHSTNLNSVDYYGQTALITAILYGNKECARVLIENQAGLDISYSYALYLQVRMERSTSTTIK